MLWFWVIVLVALIGAIAVVASGRGDSMADVYDDRPDALLPVGRPLTADDLRSLRFNTGVRGYRMDEVDALLARLEAEMLERAEDAVQPPTGTEAPSAPSAPSAGSKRATDAGEPTAWLGRPLEDEDAPDGSELGRASQPGSGADRRSERDGDPA